MQQQLSELQANWQMSNESSSKPKHEQKRSNENPSKPKHELKRDDDDEAASYVFTIQRITLASTNIFTPYHYLLSQSGKGW
jgi:hypothetical protein